MEFYRSVIDAAFVGALASPGRTKHSDQDPYGNLRVPLLESATSKADKPDDDGWYSTTGGNTEYVSIIGLPILGYSPHGKTSFSIESSYLYLDCSFAVQNISNNAAQTEAWLAFQRYNCNNGLGREMALLLNSSSTKPRGPTWQTDPREIIFGSWGNSRGSLIDMLITMVTCVVSTTRVEAKYTCDRDACVSLAVRESRLPVLVEPSVQLESITDIYSDNFCEMFINSTGYTHHATPTPLEQYLSHPDTPFLLSRERQVLGDMDETVFSHRFTQLLNTYWTAGIAAFAVLGNFTIFPYRLDEDLDTRPGGMTYFVSNATAQVQTEATVIVCNRPWLAVLLVSSFVMLAAGLATIVLNLVRRGPEVLDSFTSLLRDNAHVSGSTGPSTEDGSDKARRLRKMSVLLGDVQPEDMHGHIAVATEDVGKKVERLIRGRSYR